MVENTRPPFLLRFPEVCPEPVLANPMHLKELTKVEKRERESDFVPIALAWLATRRFEIQNSRFVSPIERASSGAILRRNESETAAVD